MAEFIKGDIVVIPYPFSDFSSFKKRPALVITTLKGTDIILCQITSRTHKDNYSIILEDSDIISGSLNQVSYIRPNKIITADSKIIQYKIGTLKKENTQIVIDKIIELIRN